MKGVGVGVAVARESRFVIGRRESKGNNVESAPSSPKLTPVIVTVTISSGRGLAAKDLNGKSDPYCLVGLCKSDNQFLGKPNKTKKVKKTLHPIWKKKNVFVFDVFFLKKYRLFIFIIDLHLSQ